MKRKIGVMTICAAVMLGSLQAGMTTVQAAPAYSGNHYGTGFDAYDEATMELSSWSNGGMFNCLESGKCVILKWNHEFED